MHKLIETVFKGGVSMSEQQLDETVRQFKNFINSHPDLIKEVRKSGRSWQEYYEKWSILGEDDPYWLQFKNESKSYENAAVSNDQYRHLFNQFLEMTDKIDLNKVQKQVGELNNSIEIINQLLNQFLDSRRKRTPQKDRAFQWFQD